MSVRIKFNVKAKLATGFIAFYVLSGIVPVIVAPLTELVGSGSDPRLVIPLITVIFSLIICIIVSIYLNKWISAPVKKLVTTTEEMVGGNLQIEAVVETGDEIESFSRSLARMKTSLRIAVDYLGPVELDKDQDAAKLKGLGIGEKILVGLIIFLILNPVIVAIPIFISPDTVLTSPFVSLLISLLLLVALVYYLNRSIMQPFADLSEAADRISKGDFGAEVSVRSRGEVGKLERNFKLIGERVHKAMKELGMND